MNLNIITTLKKFENILIGLSDHENGIDAGLLRMLGARVFEKHFTLNQLLKEQTSILIRTRWIEKISRNLKNS